MPRLSFDQKNQRTKSVVKIIGQDKLLNKEIYPRLKRNVPFILCGQRGIGKSIILKWAYDHSPTPTNQKLYLSCGKPFGQIIKEIAQVQIQKSNHGNQENQVNQRSKISELELLIFKGQKITLFLDDLEKATPKLLSFLVSLNEIWKIYLAGNDPFREESKRLLWGKKTIIIHAIRKPDRQRLAEYCVTETGSNIPVSKISNEFRGVPGRAWAIARGEYLKNESYRVQGEEINIAPALLIFTAGIVAFRYIGRSMGESDLVLLGGLGMGASVFLRYFIFSAAKK